MLVIDCTAGLASSPWRFRPAGGRALADQPVEDPFKISEFSGLRPVNFDPSTSLRALLYCIWVHPGVLCVSARCQDLHSLCKNSVCLHCL
jgi:hypothetical protein